MKRKQIDQKRVSRDDLKKNLRSSQEGMVSIIVTLIVMSILTLIVLGFAQLARREQREALDKQLSAQAFYAAESGINDADRLIKTGSFTDDKSNCDNDPKFSNVLNATNRVSYTCLLVDQTPEELKYDNIRVDQPTVVPLNPIDPVSQAPLTIDSLDISWTRSDGKGTGYYNGTDLPTINQWGTDSKAGILRLDIVQLSDSGFNRINLTQDTFTTFLYPQASGTNPSIGNAVPTNITYAIGAGNIQNQGSISYVNCNADCRVRINLPPNGISHYYLRLSSVYSSSKAVISAENSGRKVSFTDAQYIIDSTGKASNVVKRLRVYKSAAPTNFIYPPFALETGDGICKKLDVYPDGASDACPAATPTNP